MRPSAGEGWRSWKENRLMNLTLVILAAGIGSRYGGLKQIDPIGPAGEIIIDYSVFDACRAGFNKVVCVIRRAIEADFRARIAARFAAQVAVEYVYQEQTALPSGFAPPPARQKPWGTGHAVLACREAVGEPFAVINADDFYGRISYQALAAYLGAVPPAAPRYAMVGFTLRNTLSEYGSVARGICEADPAGRLRRVVERTRVEKTARGARYLEADGRAGDLSGAEFASMNMWGFNPTFFPALAAEFERFLRRHLSDPKAEFFLPTAVDELIRRDAATVQIVPTPERWMGITYPQDKPAVSAGVRDLIARGVYPQRLWARPGESL
jgi:UTP-glucose-1-phosphate uridylyltransferase